MVPPGDPRAKAAATNDCLGAGAGRWADQQTFVIEFNRTLPSGITCNVKLRQGLASLSGGRTQGKSSFAIDTGGPSVVAGLVPGFARGLSIRSRHPAGAANGRRDNDRRNSQPVADA